jgi:hypothetical protein
MAWRTALLPAPRPAAWDKRRMSGRSLLYFGACRQKGKRAHFHSNRPMMARYPPKMLEAHQRYGESLAGSGHDLKGFLARDRCRSDSERIRWIGGFTKPPTPKSEPAVRADATASGFGWVKCLTSLSKAARKSTEFHDTTGPKTRGDCQMSAPVRTSRHPTGGNWFSKMAESQLQDAVGLPTELTSD